jgi:hypothetical protein
MQGRLRCRFGGSCRGVVKGSYSGAGGIAIKLAGLYCKGLGVYDNLAFLLGRAFRSLIVEFN